jgi:hypothetical protein
MQAVKTALATVVLLSTAALASPRALPFTYPYQTIGEDELELEQFVDITPVRAFDFAGRLSWAPRTVFTTELEYGVSDRAELGLYAQASTDPGAFVGSPLFLDGVRARGRYRFLEYGSLPVDLGLYGEASILRDDFELEFKLIAQRWEGPLSVAANLSYEGEWYWSGRKESVLKPSVGLIWAPFSALQLGVEYWMRWEFGASDGVSTFDSGPLHYAGPTLMVQSRRLWMSLGVYIRLDRISRATSIGDHHGRIYGRFVVGVPL